jgi:hypothetical protein
MAVPPLTMTLNLRGWQAAIKGNWKSTVWKKNIHASAEKQDCRISHVWHTDWLTRWHGSLQGWGGGGRRRRWCRVWQDDRAKAFNNWSWRWLQTQGWPDPELGKWNRDTRLVWQDDHLPKLAFKTVASVHGEYEYSFSFFRPCKEIRSSDPTQRLEDEWLGQTNWGMRTRVTQGPSLDKHWTANSSGNKDIAHASLAEKGRRVTWPSTNRYSCCSLLTQIISVS